MSNPCPNNEFLAAYACGELTDQRADDLADHLENCPDCEAEVRTIEQDGDDLLRRLRQPISADPVLDEPACERARLLVVNAVTLGTAPHANDAVIDSSRPDSERLRDYELLEVLGRGGMGTVYRALHTKLKRVVAIKVLPPNRLQDRDSVARFQREMEAVGRLHHPNIVQPTDAGEFEGKHFLVMEFVAGCDLSAVSKRLGPLAAADACELVRQAAVGLQHAHEQGLVHRDIKPSNLILSHDGQVKILDLGLALLDEKNEGHHELTDSGHVMGTLDYMAPEQGADSHGVDIRADIYSLGATLYKLLCGRAPFDSPENNNAVKKLFALTQSEPRPIGDYRDDLPCALTQLIAQILAKDPNQRPQTPLQLAELLEKFAHGSDPRRLWQSVAASAQKNDAVPRTGISTFDFLSSPMTGTHPSIAPPKSKSALKSPTPKPFWTSHNRRLWALATTVCLALALIAVAGAVLLIPQGKGVLVIRADDEQIGVELRGKSILVSDRDNHRRYELKLGEIKQLAPGEYEVVVDELPSGVHVSTKEFTIKKNGKVALSAYFTEKPPVLARVEALQPRPTLPDTTSLVLINPTEGVTIYAVQYDPNGNRFATGSGDGRLCIWDCENGKLLAAFEAHQGEVRDVRWSPDGKLLVSAGRDGTCRLWTTDDWNLEHEIADQKGQAIWAAAWSANGEIVAYGGADHRIWLWDVRKKQIVRSFDGHVNEVQSIAFSPDGQWLISGANDREVRVWDAASGQTRDVLVGHRQGVTTVAIARNGLVFASGDYGGECRIWPFSDGELQCTLNDHAADKLGRRSILRIAFSPDSKTLATAGTDNMVRFWDAKSGESVYAWNPGIGYVWGLDWSDDGSKVIAVGVGGSGQPALHQWKSSTDQSLSAIMFENQSR